MIYALSVASGVNTYVSTYELCNDIIYQVTRIASA